MPRVFSPEHIQKLRLAKLGKPSSKKGKKTGVVPPNAFKKGQIPWNKGRSDLYTPEMRKKFSEAHQGQKGNNLGKKFGPMPEWHKRKISESLKGDKCHLWRGGICPINKAIRGSLDYRLWREAVFKRDNFTCQECGARNGNGKKITLNADHIKPFAWFPELRFAIDNGRTLCTECHRKTETYGNGWVYKTKLKSHVG